MANPAAAPGDSGDSRPMLTSAELNKLAEDLINEKGSKIPARTRSYLSNPDVLAGLKKLVAAKIPLRHIQRGYVDKLGWKVSPSVLRAFMKETFNYPADLAKNAGAVKKAAKKVVAKPKPKGRRSK